MIIKRIKNFFLLAIAMIMICGNGIVFAFGDGAIVIIYERVSQIESGGKYILAMSGITPTNLSSGQYAMKTSYANGNNGAMDYKLFLGDDNEDNSGLVWIIESFNTGFAIKAADGAEGRYLNLASGSLVFGAKQEVNISFNGQKAKITNGSNNLRFTNSNPGPGFCSSSNSASTEFYLYKFSETVLDDDIINLEPTVETPFYTIAATSDLHTDYGIQNSDPFIRQGVIDAFSKIKAEENANVLMLGGDITSMNQSDGNWDKSVYDRAMNAVYTASRNATQSNRTLFATGNHDFAVGGTNYNSGDYLDEMQNYIGEFEDVLYQQDSAFRHALAFHYIIDGLNFIILNTHYTGMDNHSSYLYESEAVEWVDNKIIQIGNDKTIVVMGHYPLRDSRNVTSSKVISSSSINDALKNALSKNNNVIYLYGHDHGGQKIKADTFERVTPYNENGKTISSNQIVPSGFVSSFVGSMGYYSGSLGASQPKVVQVLMIYFYSDRITFSMKNYGEENAGVQEIAAYSIPRDNAQLIDYKLNSIKSIVQSKNADSYTFLSYYDLNYAIKMPESTAYEKAIKIKSLELALSNLVSRQNQQELIVATPNLDENGKFYKLSVSGGSGSGKVSYEIISGGTGEGTIDDDKLMITKSGTIIIKAVKAADGNYFATESKNFTFTAESTSGCGTITIMYYHLYLLFLVFVSFGTYVILIAKVPRIMHKAHGLHSIF